MAKFNCDNLPKIVLKAGLPFRVKVAKRPKREVTERDKEIVREWWDQLPQEVLESDEPVPMGDLMHFGAEKLGQLRPEDVDALIRAQHQIIYAKAIDAMNQCVREAAEE